MVVGAELKEIIVDTVPFAPQKAVSKPKTEDPMMKREDEAAEEASKETAPLKLITSVSTYKTETPEDEERDPVETTQDGHGMPTDIIVWPSSGGETRDDDSSYLPTPSHSNATHYKQPQLAFIARAPRATDDSKKHFTFDGYTQTFTEDDTIDDNLTLATMSENALNNETIQTKIAETIWTSFLSVLPEGGGCLSPHNEAEESLITRNSIFQAVSCVNETIDKLEKLKVTSTRSAPATDELVATKHSGLKQVDTATREEEIVIVFMGEEEEENTSAVALEFSMEEDAAPAEDDAAVERPYLHPQAEFLMPLRPTTCHSWQLPSDVKPKARMLSVHPQASLLDDATITPAPSDEMEFWSSEGKLASEQNTIEEELGPFNALA